MTNTPIQIAERAPSRPIQSQLSREANLSPKFEAHGARQGRRYSDHLLNAASIVPNAGLNPGDLIRITDAALYGAKRLGRNRIEVAPTIRLVGAEREAIAV